MPEATIGFRAAGESSEDPQRLHLAVRGAVQGVGFRPFVYRLATELGLDGWVRNSAQGVFIEVEGPQEQLRAFLFRLEQENPPRSYIQGLESSYLDPVGYVGFEIRPSDESGPKVALVLPDIATCPDCLSEIRDPSDRRYQYPFANCTNCGPRFSIIEALPYDRPNTTMRSFVMCDECRAEYEDPRNRRFHAQPNACPKCGPHLEFWDRNGRLLAARHPALLAASEAVRQGRIVAVKGLGGFHLMADARNDAAVSLLRQRKRREEKPLALMYPSLECISGQCEVSDLEQRLLLSPESPIVLLRQRPSAPRSDTGDSTNPISPLVAPGNPYLGAMLPYTPLHHLLMGETGFPVVATSGNLTDEPICTDEQEALARLGGIAEGFLVHNRPIARHVDDSVLRVVLGRELVMRRARGYAPLPIHLVGARPAAPVLAVGAHMKNAVAASIGQQVFISQHVGDLETSQALDAFRMVVKDFRRLYELHPHAVACDAHPNYLSSQFAQQYGLPVITVQHHYAHVLSCMAENQLEGPLLGVSWDGTGYSPDGTIWGGEFLRITHESFERAAYFRQFPLPGGEKAVKEPKRAAIGLLYRVFGDALFNGLPGPLPLPATEAVFSRRDFSILRKMLERNLNAPLTSSAGRLFDAVASIVGLRQENRFEGQAAMELEFALDGVRTDEAYPFRISDSGTRDEGPHGEESALPNTRYAMVVDWAPAILDILEDAEAHRPVGEISARFHNTLAEIIVDVAKRIGETRVVLTGGCFQNAYLAERAVLRLRSEGFHPYWHQRVPPNDGGIALGQALAAIREMPPVGGVRPER